MLTWLRRYTCTVPQSEERKPRRPASPIVDPRDLAEDPPELSSFSPSELPPTTFTYSNKSLELEMFTLGELKMATLDFQDPERVLGEGGFGKVYKGYFYNPKKKKVLQVAVKQLNPDSFQGKNEWLAEIQVLGPLRHNNLVRLIGYCDEGEGGLLVYEYMAKGSLDLYLFNKSSPPLSWEIRLRVALHAAQGLSFLHQKNIIHRDFKGPNILLDENFNAKLTDFGLAKWAQTNQTHMTTRIMGTMGYLDPRYMETGQLTLKSDVYSFGIFLLELITGRRAQEPNSPSLSQWAHSYLHQKKPDAKSLLDPSLSHRLSEKTVLFSVHTLAIAARRCIEESLSDRPDMVEMVELLEPILRL